MTSQEVDVRTSYWHCQLHHHSACVLVLLLARVDCVWCCKFADLRKDCPSLLLPFKILFIFLFYETAKVPACDETRYWVGTTSQVRSFVVCRASPMFYATVILRTRLFCCQPLLFFLVASLFSVNSIIDTMGFNALETSNLSRKFGTILGLGRPRSYPPPPFLSKVRSQKNKRKKTWM